MILKSLSMPMQIIIVCLVCFSHLPAQQWGGSGTQNGIIYRTGSVGIGHGGLPILIEKLEVNGAIKLGTNIGTSNGIIRFTLSDFEGRVGDTWKSLTSKWNTSGNDIINNNSGNVQLGINNKLGIGRTPNSKLEIYSVDPGQNWNTGLQITSHYSGSSPELIPFDPTTYMVQRDDGFYIKSDGGYNFMNSLGTLNFVHISNNGNVGVGTTSPTAKLELNGGVFVNSDVAANDMFKIATASTENLPTVTSSIQSTYKNGRLALSKYVDDQIPIGVEEDDQPEDPMGSVSERIVFDAFGVSYLWYTTGLAIGKKTIIPGYKLDVQGKIRANEIVVNTGGADFVFEEDYNLKSLDEVEAFIKENKHLPDIPTAKEVEENGVSLGEMQTKLLQKIEELTLYLIEQEKKIRELESKMNIQ